MDHEGREDDDRADRAGGVDLLHLVRFARLAHLEIAAFVIGAVAQLHGDREFAGQPGDRRGFLIGFGKLVHMPAIELAGMIDAELEQFGLADAELPILRVRRIDELQLEKRGLERLIVRVRREEVANKEVGRKNSARRILVEKAVIDRL